MQSLLDKVIRRGTYLIFAVSPLFLGANRWWIILPIEMLTLVILACWFLKMNNFTGWRFKKTGLNLPLVLFFIAALFSAVGSIYLYASISALFKLLTYIAVFFIIANNFREEDKKRLIYLFIFMGALLSVIGLLQKFWIIPHPWWGPKQFMASLFVNHNHFAGFLEIVLPVAVCVFFIGINKERPFTIFIRALVTAAMICAFIFTLSRGGWLSLLLATFAGILIISKRKGVKFLAILLFIAIVTGVGLYAYSGRGELAARVKTVFELGKERADYLRPKIWRGSSGMIKENPLTGTGIGTFVYAFPMHRPMGVNRKIVYAHNEYLHVASEMGVFSLLLLLWMFVAVFRKCVNNIRSSHPPPVNNQRMNRAIAVGVLISLLSISLHSLVDFNLHIPTNAIYFAGLIALLQ